MSIDPITLSVVRSSLEQICDEMDLLLIRSAMSPIISETNDCAHGIYDPHTGETIAQGRLGLPVFLANMQFAVQSTIAEARATGGFRPGDVWILNDVYRGGTHLNDVNLVTPVFVGDELFALIASTGHWMDIGGSAPGGWNPEAQDIHQEGVFIPAVRLYDEGRRNDALVSMILANLRLPREILGDLTAMASAVRTGQDRLGHVIDHHGRDVVRDCLTELIDRSERQMRSYISDIPDGTYTYVDSLDNDGIVDEPMRIQVEIVIAGSDMTIDFAGTSPAARGPLNLARNSTISMCYVALKHIFPDVPINGGTFRPARVLVPDGTVTSAEYPSPVSGYLEVAGRVLDVMFGALAPAIPDLVPAAPFGTTGVVTVGGVHPERGTYYVGVFPYPGGYGATAEGDGLVHGNTPQSMANFVALEASEHRYPVRFDWFALREDSGGGGRHRGGDGTTYRIRALADCVVSVLGDRADEAPFGLHGGTHGAPNSVELTTGGETWRPPMRTKLAKQELTAGDAVTVASPGGGGFGDPLERELEAVQNDLNLGYIALMTAQDVYGVVVAKTTKIAGRTRYDLDPQGTAERRAELRRQPALAADTSTMEQT
ncbi:hydantoinase B/oxoprolinase family protein [Baekduia soli]|uniref:Hydantoinase B/oxoprolinase family protein n=1 Tax=Baekduia soli TaxID=496014 RepID=A0A5B8U5Z6_9ACTN|nr:hydantoinase B/oxoprolinase family protein [Baekduia soli]QEC48361.1 hydantoinase B/oxoprolinase family protein [Baekduia soli]